MSRGGYQSEWEYTAEWLELTRDRLEVFRRAREESVFAVSAGEDTKLPLLSEYPEKEIDRYERQQERFRESVRSMSARGGEAIRAGIMIPLEYLYRIFKADDFLKYCIMLALAPELDAKFERAYRALEDNQGYERPTIRLCLVSYTLDVKRQNRLLKSVYENAAAYESLFELPQGTESAGLYTRLYIKERIRMFLFKPEEENPKLRSFCRLALPGELEGRPLIYHLEKAERLAMLLGEKEPQERIYFLYGPEGVGKRFLVRHAHRELGRLCLLVHASAFLEEEESGGIKEILLEALIRRAGLCVWGCQELFAEWKECETAGLLKEILDRLPYVILLSEAGWPYSRENLPAKILELKLEPPNMGERVRLWERAFREEGVESYPDTEALAAKFSFTPGRIRASVREAKSQACFYGTALGEELVCQACQTQISHKLSQKATRIKAAFEWEDLVLPKLQKKLLRNACNQILYHRTVYETWGFQKKLAYGRGVSMLFYGPPGTGKTFAAQVMAHELHLELYKVDLASVMSKYIGETQKNLGSIFDEVKKSQSILFFDEADALFGKRSEVKDAQDKYANAETAYLLQKMEEYEGIVILATNFLQNFDEAFRRRIRFQIEFPLPDRLRRLEIWQRAYPKEAPGRGELDFDYLARQFELSGSSIKSIAAASAFLAAAEKEEIHMRHVLSALREEMKKSGKLLEREEFGEYRYLIEEM